jgi:hypothetical protein
MRVVNFSEARNHLKNIFGQVVEDIDYTAPSDMTKTQMMLWICHLIHLWKLCVC